MEENNFYNTTKESGGILETFKSKASAQDDIILSLFNKNPKRLFSPYDVWKLKFTENTPLTSIRRSITNLTNRGILIKTDQKVQGNYGRPTYLWQLKISHPIQTELF